MAPARPSLIGPDTCVWLWDIDSDDLPDMSQSLVALGYAPDAFPHTQASWDRLIEPEDIAATEVAYQRHADGEVDVHESRYRVRDARGELRWMVERGRIVERHPDGRPRRMVGTLTDVTQRRAAELAAQDATARLEKIAAHVPGVLYQMELRPDGRLRFLYISRQTTSLFGVPAEVATDDNTDPFSVVHRDDRAGLLQTVQASARDLSPWRHEFRLWRKGSTALWVLGNSSPQRAPDGRIIWHGYLQDVTERRELEEARHAAAVAAAASRAKSDFLSRMSHELRTPLNAVLGFAQLMEIDDSDPPSDGQRRRLTHIREAGDHLLQMIGELLDLTRIESGSMTLSTEPVLLRVLAQEALAMVQPQAEQAQVQMHLQVSGEPVARADRTRLRQVLLNLLSNAIKYNRIGGGATLLLDCSAAGSVRLQLSDSGQGIAEADLARLFEPFHRGRQAGGPIDGTGIGLSLSRSLVTMMGGRIDVASTLGQGSVFTVTLPAA